MIEIILLFIIPVYIVYKFPYCYKNRQWIFTPTLILIGLQMLIDNYTFYQLGFRSDNLAHSLIPYFIFTLFSLIISIFIANYLDKNPIPNWWTLSHFQNRFIILSFFQELVYRGYLMTKLETIFSSVVMIILVNSLIYAFIHIIYSNKLRNFAITFIAGLFFATIYYYYPNIYLITISHAALNFFAILYGIIGPNSIKNR